MTDGTRRAEGLALVAGVVVLVIAILPFVMVAPYAHPSSDDYCSAITIRDRSFWDGARHWYQHWTGRYVSIVMMNITPAVMESRPAYVGVPILLIALLVVATWWLAHETIRSLHRDARLSWAFGLAATATYLGAMPSPAEGLYWFTGSSFWTAGAVTAMLAAAAAARSVRVTAAASGRVWVVFASLFAFLAAGSNEVILLMLGWALLVPAICARRARVPTWRRWLAPLVAVAIGFAVDMAAPGNLARAAQTGGLGNPVGPAIGAAIMTLWSSSEWLTGAAVIAGLAAMVLGGSRIGSSLPEDSPWRRTSWVVPILAGIVGVWGGLFFTHWTSGFALRPGAPLRVTNVVFLFLLLAAAVSALLLGIQLLAPQVIAQGAAWRSLDRWAILTVAVLLLGRGNVRNAYEDLSTGRARTYDAELRQRFAVLDAANTADSVVVPALSRSPQTLVFRDITSDPADWRNRCYASYWRVAQVVIRP